MRAEEVSLSAIRRMARTSVLAYIRSMSIAKISILLGLASTALQANTIAVSNLGEPYFSNGSLGLAVGRISGNYVQSAFSFTTGGTDTVLDSVTLDMNAAINSPTAFHLDLYGGFVASNNVGLTGLITSLSSLTSLTTAGLHVFSGSAALSANTTYWLLASANSTANDSFFVVRGTDSLSETAGGLPGWSIGDVRRTYFNPSNPSLGTGPQNPWNSVSSQMMFSVAVSSVPESGTYLYSAWLGGIAIFAASVTRRRGNGSFQMRNPESR